MKLLAALLALAMVVGMLAGCRKKNDQNDSATGNGADGGTTPSEPVVIALTLENVYDYIAFDVELENMQSADDMSSCNVKLTVIPQASVVFSNVKITCDLVSSFGEFDRIEGKELRLQLDGTAGDTYAYSWETGEDIPDLGVVVTAVTGTVVAK